MITKRKLDKKIEGLSEFASGHLTGLQKQVDELREDCSEAWNGFDSRIKEYEDKSADLEERWLSLRDMVRVIIKHLHIPYQTIHRLLKEVDAEWHTDKYGGLPGTKDLGGELEKEADLFNQEEKPKKKRTKGETINEATERNLISLEGLRMRYGWKKAEIRGAVRDLGLEFEAIEGSPLSYINKGKIAELKDYFAK